LAALWVLSTAADRFWLALDRRLPSWDQAEYLNSAVDHGRGLGLLAGGGWQGWDHLLDLSPKIPPLASLVNGSVMAIAGQSPDAASWALAIWHALLLLVVACWGRQLLSPAFGLLAAALVACSPALAALRVDYTLDLAVAASCALALWRVGCWQAPAPAGGRWSQLLAAAGSLAAALLVKQSALLVLLPPCLWAATVGLGRRGRRLQVLAALAAVLALLLPWLHHNWITTLGGTERAVLRSAAEEGDPHPLSLASLLWYPLRLPGQLGVLSTVVGLAGALPGLKAARRAGTGGGAFRLRLAPGWGWLIGCAVSGLLFTGFSPNKDPRYIAPVLPLLLLLLARGWWALIGALRHRWGRRLALTALGVGLIGAGAATARQRLQEVKDSPGAPLIEILAFLRDRVGDSPVTVVVIPTTAEVNQHNVTTFGRMDGGRILGREVGKKKRERPIVLDQAEWVLLATGDQGTHRKISRRLSRAIRRDDDFERVAQWPWSDERRLELWRRRPGATPAVRFDEPFIALARGMENGPAGLEAVFDAIGPQHQLDGHFLYQDRVTGWARTRLERNPSDPDALWSLALLGVLQNRPQQASHWFALLEAALPSNPWPSAYRAVVLLADWKPWQAAGVSGAAASRHQEPVLRGLADLSASLSGNLLRIHSARRSLPAAIESVRRKIDPPVPPQAPAGEGSAAGGSEARR
jgi:4-amino-4-deoxy-L-arabinose transferase-like glycosyltransferase